MTAAVAEEEEETEIIEIGVTGTGETGVATITPTGVTGIEITGTGTITGIITGGTGVATTGITTVVRGIGATGIIISRGSSNSTTEGAAEKGKENRGNRRSDRSKKKEEI